MAASTGSPPPNHLLPRFSRTAAAVIVSLRGPATHLTIPSRARFRNGLAGLLRRLPLPPEPATAPTARTSLFCPVQVDLRIPRLPHKAVPQIVSRGLDHIGPDMQPVHSSETERRLLSRCLGGTCGIHAEHCLHRITYFLCACLAGSPRHATKPQYRSNGSKCKPWAVEQR